MAKAPKGGGAGGEKKSSGGFLGIVLVTLLAAGGGAGFGFYVSGNLKEKEAPKKPESAEKASEEKKPAIPPGSKIVEMAPIIVNLSEPRSSWIRIEASLVIDSELQDVQVVSGKIAEDLTAYLRTSTLSQFEGGSGFQNLREDLNERARLRGGKDVKELVLHGVVFE